MKMNDRCRLKVGKKGGTYVLKVTCVIFGFLWLLITSMVNIPDPSIPHSRLSDAYVPLSVFIPDSIYPLAKSISNSTRSVPATPTFLEDLNLTVQSVRASRMRSGGSATFIVAGQQRTLKVDLWCLFGRELITPVYTYHVNQGENRIHFLECSLPESIRRDLWYNRTEDRDVTIYLSTSTEILLQSLLTIPWSNWAEDNEQSLTLCALASLTPARYFLQWIEYHRLVGIRKFVIYLPSHKHRKHLQTTINAYEHEYPGLIDTVEWNLSTAGVPYDCLLQYADVSEWIATIDTNDYLIPPLPYETLPKLLSEEYGRRLQEPVLFVTHEFCSIYQWKRSNDALLIEQSILRSPNVLTDSRKSFQRSRTLQFLPMLTENHDSDAADANSTRIILARYPLPERKPFSSYCPLDRYMVDTTVRDRFGERLRNQLVNVN